MIKVKHFAFAAVTVLFFIGQSDGLIKLSNHQSHERHIDKLFKIFNLPIPSRRLDDQECIREYLEMFSDIKQPEKYPAFDNSDKKLTQCPNVSKSCCDKKMLNEFEEQFKTTKDRLKRLRDFAEDINKNLIKTKETLPGIIKKMWEDNPSCFKEDRAQSVEESFKVLYEHLPTMTERLDTLFSQTADAYNHVPCFLCDLEFIKKTEKITSALNSANFKYQVTINHKNVRLILKPLMVFTTLIVPLSAMVDIAKEFTCEIQDKIIMASTPTKEEAESIQTAIGSCLQNFESDDFTQEAKDCFKDIFENTDWLLHPEEFAFIYECYIVAFEFLGRVHKFNTSVMMKFEVDDFKKSINWVPDRFYGDQINKSRIFSAVISSENSVDLAKYKLVLSDSQATALEQTENSSKIQKIIGAIALICLIFL